MSSENSISGATNHYELLAILDGRIADSEVDAFRATFEDLLKKYVSPIHYMHTLGRRKLAYPINHQGNGVYLLCEFDAAGDAIKKLERALILTTEILRHCIVRRATVGSPAPLERHEESIRRRPERGTRKTQDEELLGKTPIEELVSAPAEEPTPQPAVPVPAAQAEEQQTKKGGKVSFEELDKKLHELLSDEIL